jgi:hypothetical protein
MVEYLIKYKYSNNNSMTYEEFINYNTTIKNNI